MLIVAAGCRIGFDPVIDEPPVSLAALPCNRPTPIASDAMAAMPMLAAAPHARGVALAWTDAGMVTVGGLTDDGSVRAVFAMSELIDDAHAGHVAVASAGGATLIAGGSTSQGATSSSQLVVIDGELRPLASATASAVRVLDARGAIATSDGWLLAGALFETGHHTAVVALDREGRALAAPVVLAEGKPDVVTAIALDDGWAIASQLGDRCTIAVVDRALAPVSPATTWQRCADVTGAHVAGGPEVVVAWRDAETGMLASSVLAGGALGAASMLGIADDRPRVVASADGFWIATRADGELVVTPLDRDGRSGAPHALGPIGEGAAYDLVTIDGESYATWWTDSLTVARVCR
ncbi:MAG TPA: hypothetical protein VFQ53_10310 [Kofleriaceae bacterium]|nr:hypothetical protein [Kofleriaceae bacterium]